MKNQTSYQKIASYEVQSGTVKKVVLLYSGGLDTSVMLKWIKDNYKAEVITLTIDLGQQNDDMEKIKAKALRLGASKAFVIDAKKEFAEEYLARGIKANASYQGQYHLSTPMGRPLIAKWAVKIAEQEKADAIAHGATGKGNDQVRMEAAALAENPKIKVIAPVREWSMDRNEEIEYARENGIEVPVKKDFPYSVDDNMWGMTWEGGEIEYPNVIPPIERFLTTYNRIENTPDKPEFVKLTFKKGLPVKLNGKALPLHTLIEKLNKIAGNHSVGVIHLTEDRLIGLKSRGVYESPSAHTIIEAHRALEHYVSTRVLNEAKEGLDIKWAYLCYGALWKDPTMKAINAFNDSVNERVNGEVTVKLFKGHAMVVAMESPDSLDYTSFNNTEGYNFNVNASASFTEIYSLQSVLINQKKK